MFMRGKIAYRVLVAKGDVGVHGRYFKVDLNGMGWKGVGCIHLAQDRT